jgi:hypothetical protein
MEAKLEAESLQVFASMSFRGFLVYLF